ncbi:MAG: carboxymuconolactone decarboxylase family protein [Candidatus Microthrix sp.]|jgi:AhpD family alkylhydroperoxidase|nr:carboxymuconolactone decarboxylase family protein [Candidatus Microthrix sp.]
MSHYHDIAADLREPSKSLRAAIPEVYGAFGALHQAATGDGALSGKTKELIALAISVVKQCDGCIGNHAKAAARQGATPDEVADALGVAFLMDGGPATVYGPRAWAAFHEFAGIDL